jgi:hypothetical protein
MRLARDRRSVFHHVDERRIVIVSLLAATSCSFASDGMGGQPGLGPDSASGSTGGSAGSEDVGDPTSGDPSPTSDGTSADDSTSAVETTTGAPGSPARLMYAPNALDFGNVVADGDYVLELDVRNTGGSPALILTDVLIPGPFGLSGGYPGAGGTCGDELGAGESCTLAVGFHPSTIGPHVSSLDLTYYDGVDLAQPVMAPSVGLAGGGIGETENLILNPGAESGVDAWAMAGSTWEATDGDAFEGSYAFEAGNPGLGNTTLTQSIALGEWSDPLALGGLHFRFAAAGRAPESGSSYRIDLDFGTGSVSPLQGTSSEWDPVNATGPVPLGATAVTVTLVCVPGAFDACGALFDGLALSLVYPPPS